MVVPLYTPTISVARFQLLYFLANISSYNTSHDNCNGCLIVPPFIFTFSVSPTLMDPMFVFKAHCPQVQLQWNNSQLKFFEWHLSHNLRLTAKILCDPTLLISQSQIHKFYTLHSSQTSFPKRFLASLLSFLLFVLHPQVVPDVSYLHGLSISQDSAQTVMF